MAPLTFPEYRARWEALPSHVVNEMFGELPEREQNEAWDAHLAQVDAGIDTRLEWERQQREPWCPACRGRDHEPPCERKRHQPAMRSHAATSATTGTVSLSSGDPLKRTPPSEYVEAFTGQAVPASNKVWCPLHDERGEPSFHVYPDHWHCFGCHTTGGVYELASRLTGLSTRGHEFLELRRWVAARLLDWRGTRHA